MSGIDVYKWRVIITATQAEDFVWRDENQGDPTVASGGEPIDIAKSRIVDTILDDEIVIKEEKIPTGGNIRFESLVIDAPANQVTTQTFSWQIPINVISSIITTSTDNTGDTISWNISPNTTIGGITSDVAISDTVINVVQTVVDNIKVGFKCRVADGTQPTVSYEDLGQVLAVDTTNLQITVSTAATAVWAAATPTLVQMTVTYADEIEFGPPANYSIGESKIGTSYVPAGVALVGTYNNKSPTTAKKLYTYLQYLY